MGCGQLLRYLFTTLLARWAGVELLGIYSISNAVTRIFEVIGKLGLDQGTLRGVSREEENLKKQSVILSALKMGAISEIGKFIVTKNVLNQRNLIGRSGDAC